MMLEELKRPFREKSEGGFVLLLMLVTSITLFIALSGILSLALANLSGAKRTMFDTGALYAAESGVDNAMKQLNSSAGTYTGTTSCAISNNTSGAVSAFNDTVKGKGTYQTCIAAGSISHEFIIYSVGRVYKTSSATSPVATKKLKVVVEGNPVGAYAVQTGPGGLIMSNSATVSQGPISVGGYLTMSNSATIGSTSSPIAVSVANYRCGNGGVSTTNGYAQLCNTGVNPNPITLNSNQNHIYGSVIANGQVATNYYPTQITNTGIVANTGASAPTLPTYDRVAQVTAVANNLTGAQASCSGNGTTVTWPANVKITGNVTMKNSCKIIVSGNAWITGSFSMSNSSIIQTGAGVTTQPTVMVDGLAGVSTSQTATVATNSSQIGMEFITFYSTNACTTATTSSYCETLTGSDLINSQTVSTINVGNQGAASGSVFYAKYSQVTLSQGGSIGALLGQTISLAQSGNIVFTSTVSTGNYAYTVNFYEFQ
jgi:hypothetical protein